MKLRHPLPRGKRLAGKLEQEFESELYAARVVFLIRRRNLPEIACRRVDDRRWKIRLVKGVDEFEAQLQTHLLAETNIL